MKTKNEHKTPDKKLSFELKLLPQTKDGKVWFEGYANTVTKDRVNDSVLPSAFIKSLPTYMTNPQLLYQHNWDISVGSITEAKPDDKGLFVKGFVSAAPDCESYRTKVLERVLRTLSIGYNEVDSEMDEASKTKIVKEVELLEISLVTIPANAEAIIQPVEQVEGGEPPKSVVPDELKALTEQVKGLMTEVVSVTKLLETVKQGAQIVNTNTDPKNPAQGKAEPKPGAEPAAAPAAAPAAGGSDMAEVCKGLAALNESVKAMHETLKNVESCVKSGQGNAEPKSIDEMSDAEVEAALAAEAAQLAGMTSVPA